MLTLALLQSMVNLGVDLLYASVDPRIRSQYVIKKKVHMKETPVTAVLANTGELDGGLK